MKNILFQSDFFSNIAKLITGTVIAQIISITVAPLLTRIYSPEDFGSFATYISIVVLLAITVTGRYETAIMQPKKELNALELLQAALLLSFLVSIAIFIIIMIFHESILKQIESTNINSFMLIFIPVGVIATSFYNTIAQWLNRRKEYSQMSINRIYQACSTALVSLMLGHMGLLATGLIVGYVTGFIVSILLLLMKLKIETNFYLNGVIKTAKKYKKYPTIDLPASFLNVISNYLPVISISFLMGAKYAGFYFLVERVLKAPIGIISASIGNVFRQEAISEKHECGTFSKTFSKTFRSLLIIGVPLFIFIFSISSSAFEFLFGSDWIQSGVFAQILTPMFFLRFISSPLSFSFYISDKLHYDLIGQFIFTIGIVASVFIGFMSNDINKVILGISFTGSIVYISYFVISYKLSRII